MKKAQDIGGRIIALFLTNALGVITGAAVIAPDLEVWKSACIAGAVSVFKVAESLAKSSIDGVLTKDEIDAAFGATPKKIASKRAASK
jgi:alpha-beta hydrolase superfamily lysophospholipase